MQVQAPGLRNVRWPQAGQIHCSAIQGGILPLRVPSSCACRHGHCPHSSASFPAFPVFPGPASSLSPASAFGGAQTCSGAPLPPQGSGALCLGSLGCKYQAGLKTSALGSPNLFGHTSYSSWGLSLGVRA